MVMGGKEPVGMSVGLGEGLLFMGLEFTYGVRWNSWAVVF